MPGIHSIKSTTLILPLFVTLFTLSMIAGLCLPLTAQTDTFIAGTGLDVYGTSFTNQGTISVGSGNGIGILSPSGSTTTLSGAGTINFTNSGSRLCRKRQRSGECG